MMKIRIKHSFSCNDILFVLISIYLLYTIWFQYAVGIINGLLIILGAVMFLFSVLEIQKKRIRLTPLVPILSFLLIAGVACLFSINLLSSMRTVFQIVKYCIPMLAVYVYLNCSRDRITNLFKVMFVACTLIALSSFTQDLIVVTYSAEFNGEEGLLNANVFSSYLMMGTMSGFYLFLRSKYKIPILIVLGIDAIAQFNSGSRRGAIVFMLLVLAFIHTKIFVNKDKSKLSKPLMIVLVCTVFFFLSFNIIELSDNFISIQRILAGTKTTSDFLRKTYMRQAIHIFLNYPILGRGLNAVAFEGGMYSHCFYTELLACTGIIGTLVVLSFFSLWLRQFFKASAKTSGLPNEERIECRLWFWYVFTVLLCGIAVTLIYDFYFYILIGLFASISGRLKQQLY